MVLKYLFLSVWQLSMWRCNDELRDRAHELHRSSKRDAKHYIGMYFFLSFWTAHFLNLYWDLQCWTIYQISTAKLLDLSKFQLVLNILVTNFKLLQSFGNRFLQMSHIVLFLEMWGTNCIIHVNVLASY